MPLPPYYSEVILVSGMACLVAQNLALRELKRDRDHIVLTADKGVAMVIMDRQDYINKANYLLNQNTYRSITKDPTNSIKIN